MIVVGHNLNHTDLVPHLPSSRLHHITQIPFHTRLGPGYLWILEMQRDDGEEGEEDVGAKVEPDTTPEVWGGTMCERWGQDDTAKGVGVTEIGRGTCWGETLLGLLPSG